MNNPAEETPWDEQTRILRLLGDRFVALGWAVRVVTAGGGIRVDWTATGRRKMSTLHALMRELGYETFTPEHSIAFFAWLKFHGLDPGKRV